MIFYSGFTKSFISKPQDNLAVGKMETKCFKYLGINIKHEENRHKSIGEITQPFLSYIRKWSFTI